MKKTKLHNNSEIFCLSSLEAQMLSKHIDGYLDDFIEWKTQKGYIVDVVYTNDIGTSASSIRAYLLELYNNPSIQLPAPSFVLLVGDTNQIPASYSSGGHVSDLNYCDFTGDNMPEILHGRFSASTPTQLRAQVDKTLMYEKYEFPDPSFLADVIMISGVDANYAPTYGNGQINYGNNYYFNSSIDPDLNLFPMKHAYIILIILNREY